MISVEKSVRNMKRTTNVRFHVLEFKNLNFSQWGGKIMRETRNNYRILLSDIFEIVHSKNLGGRLKEKNSVGPEGIMS
jgi:hypothetical protein